MRRTGLARARYNEPRRRALKVLRESVCVISGLGGPPWNSRVAKLMKQLDRLVEARNFMVVIEHEMFGRRGERLHLLTSGEEGGYDFKRGDTITVADRVSSNFICIDPETNDF